LARDLIRGGHFAVADGIAAGCAGVFVQFAVRQNEQQPLPDRLSTSALLAEER
jgi:hypothetical protein